MHFLGCVRRRQLRIKYLVVPVPQDEYQARASVDVEWFKRLFARAPQDGFRTRTPLEVGWCEWWLHQDLAGTSRLAMEVCARVATLAHIPLDHVVYPG